MARKPAKRISEWWFVAAWLLGMIHVMLGVYFGPWWGYILAGLGALFACWMVVALMTPYEPWREGPTE